ncbi:MAG TPA: hypothetical protein VKV57_12915 [bacterium]|nr:hypothetical protein [bacterium]
MPTRKRGSLRISYTKSATPSGIAAVDSIRINGRSRGQLRPGTILTPEDQSRFCVRTNGIHKELIEWHWRPLSGKGDRLVAVVEVCNYGRSPIIACLARDEAVIRR